MRLVWTLAVGGLLAVVLGLVVANSLEPEPTHNTEVPPPPGEVTVTFNFLDGPSLVYLCWTHPGDDLTFFDVKVESWDEDPAPPEVRYGVSPSDCGDAYGNGQYMWRPGLYHYAVRACNNAGCSEWADATSGEAYWHSVPCTDATGAACVQSHLAQGSP